MGVYIKGMEIPKGKPLLVKINPDGTVSTTWKNGYKKYEAVELPPHGDLVERQVVLNTFSIHMNRTRHFVTIRDTVPTIIPAEEEE